MTAIKNTIISRITQWEYDKRVTVALTDDGLRMFPHIMKSFFIPIDTSSIENDIEQTLQRYNIKTLDEIDGGSDIELPFINNVNNRGIIQQTVAEYYINVLKPYYVSLKDGCEPSFSLGEDYVNIPVSKRQSAKPIFVLRQSICRYIKAGVNTHVLRSIIIANLICNDAAIVMSSTDLDPYNIIIMKSAELQEYFKSNSTILLRSLRHNYVAACSTRLNRRVLPLNNASDANASNANTSSSWRYIFSNANAQQSNEQTVKKEETPKEEAPKEEAPKEETPKEETPKEEAPKTEAPKEETPKEEAPKTEAPKTEAPKEETPKEEAPKAETPKAEAPMCNVASVKQESKPPVLTLSGEPKEAQPAIAETQETKPTDTTNQESQNKNKNRQIKDLLLQLVNLMSDE